MDKNECQLADGFIIWSDGCLIHTDKFICKKCNNNCCYIIEKYSRYHRDEGMNYLLHCKKCHREDHMTNYEDIKKIEKIKMHQFDGVVDKYIKDMQSHVTRNMDSHI